MAHNNLKKDGDKDVVYLWKIISFFTIGGMICSYNLWLSSREFPLFPLFFWIGPFTFPFDIGILVVAMINLLFIFFKRRPFWAINLFLGLALILILQDINRLQPWFYQYLFMLFLISLYVRGSISKNEMLLNQRLLIIFILFWAGFFKINTNFVREVFPWITFKFFGLPLSTGLKEAIALTCAISESLFSLGLLFSKTRRASLVFFICMFLGLFMILGPFGHNWNRGVWPWIIGMMFILNFLFSSFKGTINIFEFGGFKKLRIFTIVFFGLMPGLSKFGLWDSYASFHLYSGDVDEFYLEVSPSLLNRSIKPGRKFASVNLNSNYKIDFFQWSMDEFNVPNYPEKRFFVGYFEKVCRKKDAGDMAKLVRVSYSGIFNLEKKVEEVYCNDIKL